MDYMKLAQGAAQALGQQQQAQPMQGHPAATGAGGGQLDPQLVQAILSLQQQNAQESAVSRQRKMAEMLRADAGGQLQGRQMGRLYQSPNLANLAANIYGNYKAGQMDADADTRTQNMGVQTQDAMRRYFEAMTGNRRPGVGYMGAEGE